jgi:hypothetical protein
MRDACTFFISINSFHHICSFLAFLADANDIEHIINIQNISWHRFITNTTSFFEFVVSHASKDSIKHSISFPSTNEPYVINS